MTTAIKAKDAAFTPSRKALAAGERLRRGASGPLMATNMKAGRKIPAVLRIAPGIPDSTYPMKVAVVNTGPGVI
jgi:hypothetical protein